jgi:histidine triad (HIT) family protein
MARLGSDIGTYSLALPKNPRPTRRIDSLKENRGTMAEPTLFTRIIRGEVPAHIIARSEYWVAFLDIYPRRPGHTLVVPIEPVSHLRELSAESRRHLLDGVIEAQHVLSKRFETDDFLVGIHDGSTAGQEVPHVHIHVIPRTLDDGGLTLLSCWPHAPAPGGTPDFEELRKMADSLEY